MHFLPDVAGCNKLFQKIDKGGTGMPLGCLALHLASLHIQRRIQGQSAVATVFETVIQEAPDPNDPELQWRFSRPRKIQPHAAVKPSTGRSRRQPYFKTGSSPAM